jgi:hypothetical protein
LISARYEILKSLADPHAERVTVPSLSDIGTKIDMILLAQREPQPAATTRQEFLTPVSLSSAGDRSANATEYN